jgi:hypothetical protein
MEPLCITRGPSPFNRAPLTRTWRLRMTVFLGGYSSSKLKAACTTRTRLFFVTQARGKLLIAVLEFSSSTHCVVLHLKASAFERLPEEMPPIPAKTLWIRSGPRSIHLSPKNDTAYRNRALQAVMHSEVDDSYQRPSDLSIVPHGEHQTHLIRAGVNFVFLIFLCHTTPSFNEQFLRRCRNQTPLCLCGHVQTIRFDENKIT